MSFAICRVDKCSNAHDIAGAQIHDRRERDHSNTNPDIDFERTPLNYSLCHRADGKSFNATVNEIIAAEYTSSRAIRKDAVRMVQLLFTSDNEFFDRLTPEQQRDFFQSCYDWAAKRFGESHIVSAVVHMDEETPHMHLNLVPLVQDVAKKTGEVITTLNVHKAVGSGSRAFQKLQDDFYKAVGIPFGLERGNRADLENGEKPRKHQRVSEYKASTNFYEQEKNALQATVQALQEQEQAYTDILHAEPLNAVEGVPVPSMAKLAIGKENRDKLLYSPQEIEQVRQLAEAAAVVAAANEQHKQELINRQNELIAEENRIKEHHNDYLRSQTKWHNAAITEQQQGMSKLFAEKREVEKRERAVSERERDVDTREYRVSEEEHRINKRISELTEIEERPDKHYQSIIQDMQRRIDELTSEMFQRDRDDEEILKQMDEIGELMKQQLTTIDSLTADKFDLQQQLIELQGQLANSSAEYENRLSNVEQELQTEQNEHDNTISDYNRLCDKYNALVKIVEYISEHSRYSDVADDLNYYIEKVQDNYRLSYIMGDEGRSR